MNFKKYLPQKSDYPDNLNVLNDMNSKYYYNAIEGAASAYFNSSFFYIYRFFYIGYS